MTKTEQEYREDIIRVCRLVYEKGWVAGNDGNISIPAGERLHSLHPHLASARAW